ncbi:MAG: hypothetical protein HYW90_04515 [Candidatus Sungbacteria bacterium]|nr:hypothetical protein [Candidatus Sungbacteria bacterium]
MFQLTIKEIDDLCQKMREIVGAASNGYPRKIDAIRLIRQGLPFCLKEAKEYADQYFPDRLLDKFRYDMLRMAGLTDKLTTMVYDHPAFRLEVKDSSATFEDLQRFLQTAWEEMHKPATESTNT